MPQIPPTGHDAALCVTERDTHLVLRDVWTVLMRDAGLSTQTRRHLKVAYEAALDPRLEPRLRRALYGKPVPPAALVEL
jgi:hypothetical protein